MSRLILYKCETPLHVGSGNELGIVDMPIQRENHTGFPKIEASSIKGSFRNETLKDEDLKKYTNYIFGVDSCEENNEKYAGSMNFTDAKILFFPVKSAKGIFGWITCPFIINRFNNDIKIMKSNLEDFKIQLENSVNLKDENAMLCKNSNLIMKKNNKDYIFLEEFGYKVETQYKNIFKNIVNLISDNGFIKEKLEKDIVILSDEAFKYFVEMSTEINTRIRIGENGVVEQGGLFTEEYLPTESILYSFIEDNIVEVSKKSLEGILTGDFQKLEDKFVENLVKNKIIHLGGNTTLGKGIISMYSEKEGK